MHNTTGHRSPAARRRPCCSISSAVNSCARSGGSSTLMDVPAIRTRVRARAQVRHRAVNLGSNQFVVFKSPSSSARMRGSHEGWRAPSVIRATAPAAARPRWWVGQRTGEGWQLSA